MTTFLIFNFIVIFGLTFWGRLNQIELREANDIIRNNLDNSKILLEITMDQATEIKELKEESRVLKIKLDSMSTTVGASIAYWQKNKIGDWQHIVNCSDGRSYVNGVPVDLTMFSHWTKCLSENEVKQLHKCSGYNHLSTYFPKLSESVWTWYDINIKIKSKELKEKLCQPVTKNKCKKKKKVKKHSESIRVGPEITMHPLPVLMEVITPVLPRHL